MNGRMSRLAALGVAAVLLLTLPAWVANSYYVNIASQILLWAVAALALNVLVGYGGLVSLGHAALFGTAGYTAALLLKAGHGHLLADFAAIGFTLLVSAIFAILSLALDRDCILDDHARARSNPVGDRLSLGQSHARR